MTTQALLIYELGSQRRLGAAWDAIAAEEKAQALEARGFAVGMVPVAARRRARRPNPPAPPYGYRIRPRPPIAASTARRPWTDWRGDWAEIKAAGGWTPWGEGHATAPIVAALEGRGKLLVAEWVGRGRRRRNLFLAID